MDERSKNRVARAEPHELRLDLVVGMVARGENIGAPLLLLLLSLLQRHRVKHQSIARGTRYGLDRFATRNRNRTCTCTRVRDCGACAHSWTTREGRLAPGYAQLGVQ